MNYIFVRNFACQSIILYRKFLPKHINEMEKHSDEMAQGKIRSRFQSGQPFQNYDFGENWDKVVQVLKSEPLHSTIQKKIKEEAYFNYSTMGFHLDFNPVGQTVPREQYYDILARRYGPRGTSVILQDRVFVPLNAVSLESDPFNVTICDIVEYGERIGDSRISEDMKKLISAGNGYLHSRELDAQLDILGISLQRNPYWIGHWSISQTCFFTNKHVSLPVARILFPEKDWCLVEGCDHCTVMCPEDSFIKQRKTCM
jgi:hypothetical protein